jgi:hypothetical protein
MNDKKDIELSAKELQELHIKKVQLDREDFLPLMPRKWKNAKASKPVVSLVVKGRQQATPGSKTQLRKKNFHGEHRVHRKGGGLNSHWGGVVIPNAARGERGSEKGGE